MKLLLSLMGAGLLCGGCASVSPERYSKEQPLLDLSRYLEGPLEASGMFQNRKGEVVKRFHVKLLVMLNRAVMSKWGFRLGEVTLSFRKLR